MAQSTPLIPIIFIIHALRSMHLSARFQKLQLANKMLPPPNEHEPSHVCHVGIVQNKFSSFRYADFETRACMVPDYKVNPPFTSISIICESRTHPSKRFFDALGIYAYCGSIYAGP